MCRNSALRSPADAGFYLLCRAPADVHTVFFTHMAGYLLVERISGNAQGIRLADTALADYSHIRGACADVYNERARGLKQIHARSERGAQRLLHKADGARAGGYQNGDERSFFNIRGKRGNACNNARLEDAFFDYLIYEKAHHIAGDVVIRYRAAYHRADNGNAVRLAPLKVIGAPAAI